MTTSVLAVHWPPVHWPPVRRPPVRWPPVHWLLVNWLPVRRPPVHWLPVCWPSASAQCIGTSVSATNALAPSALAAKQFKTLVIASIYVLYHFMHHYQFMQASMPTGRQHTLSVSATNVGHQCVGHQCIGHQCVGHQCISHQFVGRQCVSRQCICCQCTGPVHWPSALALVDWLSSELEQFITFGNLFWYKPTTHRLVPNFYGNLRPAGAQTIWLLHFMLQMYTTQQKTSLLKITIQQRTTPWWSWLPV